MKRLHVHVAVKELEPAVQFYSTLFGQEPIKLKPNYAKWLLDDPRVNFAISTGSDETGINHLGIQVESPEELHEITARLKDAELGVYGEGEATCCYAKSNKAWVADPAGVPWETYQNMADVEIFSDAKAATTTQSAGCCVPKESKTDSAKAACC